MTHEFNHAESAVLAKQLQALFKHWQLSPAQQLAVLGFGGSANAIESDFDWSSYLAGKNLEFAGHLLAIHASLRTLILNLPTAGYKRPTRPSRAQRRSL